MRKFTTILSTILVAGLCYLLVTIPLGFVVRRMEAIWDRPSSILPRTTWWCRSLPVATRRSV